MSFKLSYESVILDSVDIEILESCEWFNDKLLTFIGEYLMNTMNSGDKKEIHVFTPSETEMIRHSGCDKEVEMYFGVLGCAEIPLIAWIVNNNQDVTRAYGGSHWSLLVFDRKTNQFYHFDSSAGYNALSAEALMRKSRKLVNAPVQKSLTVEQCLQQRNSSDCGLHVAQYLATLVEEKDITSIGKLQKIEKTRAYWKDFILNFEN